MLRARTFWGVIFAGYFMGIPLFFYPDRDHDHDHDPDRDPDPDPDHDRELFHAVA